MKLLLDQNLSYRLVNRLLDIFPEVSHLKTLGLIHFTDIEIWDFSKENAFTIVTFDRDFFDLSVVRNAPPKIIFLNLYNQSITETELLLRQNENEIKFFVSNTEIACLTLSKRN